VATMETNVTGRPLSGAVPATADTVMGPATTLTVADPAPLGLAAFGLTTLVLSCINAGWVDKVTEPAVLALAVPFGGGAQLLAGMWAFRRGNTFAATAFSSYGAFWLSFFLLVQFYAPRIVAAPGGGVAELNTILGLYLFAWGVFTAYMFLASLAGAKAVQLVFILLALTFFALALGAWEASTTWTHIGGILGVLTAVAALYTSFADVANASFRRTVLPTGAP
jgi:uncharacterized protein